MNLYRGQFRRLIELDQRIRARRYPNCTTFSKEWQVSAKSVQRDIQFLKYSLGAPIEYDFNEKGYYYTDPSWQMPGMRLTEAELLQMLFAKQMAEHFRGTPLAASLDSLFGKLRLALSEEVSIDPEVIGTQFSFYGRPQRPVSEAVWTDLVKAIRHYRVVEISYRKAPGQTPERRILEPVHLACLWDEWYLVAWCRQRDDWRNFAVSRVLEVVTLKQYFEPRDFDPNEYYSNRFQQMVGRKGEAREVLIRFTKEESPWVLERQWHPRQEVKEESGGSIVLSFPAPDLYEVKRWVLQWGREAEVLAPEELRQELRKDAEALLQRY